MEKIYEMLRKVRPDVNFETVNDYMEEGALDSFDIMSLVELLENTFSIEIGGRDIVEDNFKNAEAVAALVKKCGGTL